MTAVSELEAAGMWLDSLPEEERQTAMNRVQAAAHEIWQERGGGESTPTQKLNDWENGLRVIYRTASGPQARDLNP